MTTKEFATINAGKVFNSTCVWNGEEMGFCRVVGYKVSEECDCLIVELDSSEGWSIYSLRGDADNVLTYDTAEGKTYLYVSYDFLEPVTEVVEEESEFCKGWEDVKNILIGIVIVLSLLFIYANNSSAQVSVSKSKTEKLSSARLGNISLNVDNGIYFILMTDKTNSMAKARLQFAGYDLNSGVVPLVLGDKKTAVEVLEYLSTNKPGKGEEINIGGNENMVISYSGFNGGWQFQLDGMIGNMSKGEAKKFLRAINK